MTLEELHDWILSPEGMQSQIALLSQFAAAKSIGLSALAPDLNRFVPDWPRLIFAGSILASRIAPRNNDAALTIAQAGLLYSNDERVSDASAVILMQLANHRAVQLAESRGILRSDLHARLGTVEKMLSARRELSQSVFLSKGDTIHANAFQRQFWDELERAAWVSASAPTASGKTYLILRWLLNQFVAKRSRLAVFLAPTRALVGEIERELLELATLLQISGLRIASLPIANLGDGSLPTILVFTQERLHVFLNSMESVPVIDIAVIDEVHKLGDGLRGVILQDAVERVVRSNSDLKLIFLSPLTDNPELVLSDAPEGLETAVVPSDTPTVCQNLILAQQQPREPARWMLQLKREGQVQDLGEITLHARPDNDSKRLSYMGLALGRDRTGTLIYANGPAEAEKLAWQIFNSLEGDPSVSGSLDTELKNLSDFTRDTIHPDFQLVELVKRGIAFHYGNMPTLLRSEIERLFRAGKIRFLVCTSTLVEGVNLACRTIVVRGPRKGNGNPMGAHDFWNLAGRAGRWGQDFHGNIVCIDVNRVNLWPDGAPERARYPISRETENVLSRRDEMLAYLDKRAGLSTALLDAHMEQVTAYLLSWKARTGSFLSAPAALRLDEEYRSQLEDRLTVLLENVDLPIGLIARHPGVSAIALQTLLNTFRSRRGSIENFIPAPPSSEDAYDRLVVVFQLINENVYPAFMPAGIVPLHVLVTLEWMRGLPLGQIIRRRITYLQRNKRAYKLPSVIRDTMRDVEEVARFKAPKYLAAYLDVLNHHLHQTDQAYLFPDNLKFDLYLEFGVATQTLLSLIGLGLSRTSAIALNEFLGNDRLSEDQLVQQLGTRRWMNFDMPAIVKNEIAQMLERRRPAAVTNN
jgi:hypothetical protein